MEDNEVTSRIERLELWVISIIVTLLFWLVAVVVVTACWDHICARMVIDGLEYGAEQVVSETVFDATPTDDGPEVRYYRPDTSRLKTLEDHLEDVKAYLDRTAPAETFDELLERLDRERRELEPG